MFFRCNFTVYGRYVYIRIPGAKKILTLCEVEVYSTITSSKMAYDETDFKSRKTFDTVGSSNAKSSFTALFKSNDS